jgi:hypothetical protein
MSSNITHQLFSATVCFLCELFFMASSNIETEALSLRQCHDLRAIMISDVNKDVANGHYCHKKKSTGKIQVVLAVVM